MAVTFGNFKKALIRLLGDTEVDSNPSGPIVAGKQNTAGLLMEGCHAALRAITGRQWKSATFDLGAGLDEGTCPADLIAIDAVYDKELDLFIPKTSFAVGSVLSDSSIQGNSWMDIPSGKITFTNTLGASGAKVYYLAAWTPPLVDADTLECPDMCLTALLYFAASYCFLRKASMQSDLASFKTKVDSGTPEDIPAVRVATNFLKNFEIEYARIPAKQRATD